MTLAVSLHGEATKPSHGVCNGGAESEMLNARTVSNDWPIEPNGKDWPLGSSFALPILAKELHHMAA